tara:strand:- start:204 stop:347 length:144 start_codon:yes stop_codon:yes gene_type:complete
VATPLFFKEKIMPYHYDKDKKKPKKKGTMEKKPKKSVSGLSKYLRGK